MVVYDTGWVGLYIVIIRYLDTVETADDDCVRRGGMIKHGGSPCL